MAAMFGGVVGQEVSLGACMHWPLAQPPCSYCTPALDEHPSYQPPAFWQRAFMLTQHTHLTHTSTYPLTRTNTVQVVKAVSGKFHPILQWFYFDSVESLPEGPLPAEETAAEVGIPEE
jgi:hypothetical protein